ncbi:MAG: nucleoside recognition family protein [Deltaproteobacteria bacterium HGW-Deltaproteobacteria-10]|nr:MAG: nucleoside recognition family protein [Deltaproteobacteria bacterium HGW-Deltaproteobacteria-10]
MQDFLNILLASGKKGFELAFFVLMPIMVFMMAIMRVLDKKGVLRLIAIFTAPVLLIFGIPGLGVFAILQILLVSFAAPVSTFRIMDQDIDISDRKIAAALAAILTMSQANATLPLTVFGLNLPVTMLTSLVGGLLASFLTYKIFARNLADSVERGAAEEIKKEDDKQKTIQIIMAGAEEGFQLVLKAVPLFVLAVFMVNVLKAAGAITLMEKIFGPVLSLVGISGAAVLSIVTKYIAGGTAMMGATIPLIQDKAMTAVELNKIAGFTINPLDAVGVAVLVSSGKRVAAFVMPAIKGAIIGILFRGIIHLIIF